MPKLRTPAFFTIASALLLSVTASTVQGAVISTQQALEIERGAVAVERVQGILQRDDARAALIRFGVDPEQAAVRVATLTPAEAQQLAAKLDRLPAGSTGLIEVIGIAAVVLLLLEILGVTNVFTKL